MAKNTKAPFDVTNLTPSRETYLVCTVLDAGKLGSNREILVRLFTHNNPNRVAASTCAVPGIPRRYSVLIGRSPR
jgi:hypothetical protein